MHQTSDFESEYLGVRGIIIKYSVKFCVV